MQAARSSLANHTSIAELIKEITSMYSHRESAHYLVCILFMCVCLYINMHFFFFFTKIIFYCVYVDSASEAFFDNLTVEQEFMTGVDTDKVFVFIYLHISHHLILTQIL